MTRSVRYAVRIAVDLLGGDSAPAVVVDGVLRALRTDPALHVVLVGPEQAGEQALAALDEPLRARVDLAPASDVVAMDERPVRAVRQKPAATVRVAVEALRDGAADAVFTAGASGAAVAAATLALGLLPGVKRPALAVVIPAGRGPVILLDVGATPDPSARILVQHGQLGVAYARARGLASPRLGLLSIGVEHGKGDALRGRVDGRLGDLSADGRLGGGDARYVGLVEGHHVPLGGVADVVVTDGFTGNVLLKGMEGVGQLLRAPDHDETASGALLLGVQGTVVVGHGAAGASSIAGGLALAAAAVRGGYVDGIAADLAALAGGGAPSGGSTAVSKGGSTAVPKGGSTAADENESTGHSREVLR